MCNFGAILCRIGLFRHTAMLHREKSMEGRGPIPSTHKDHTHQLLQASSFCGTLFDMASLILV